MKFISLQIRLVAIFGLCIVLTIGGIVAHGVISSEHSAKFVEQSAEATLTAAVEQQIMEKARAISLYIQVELEVALDTARTMADVFGGVKDPRIRLTIDRKRVNGMLRGVVERNAEFLGAYTLWEPNALDDLDSLYANTEGHDETGRFVTYWNRGADGTITSEVPVDYENQETSESGARKGEYYLCPRERKRECVIDPYPYPVQGKLVWTISLVAPIFVNEHFYGIAGVDMASDFIQAKVDEANSSLYSGAGNVAVISHRGLLVAATGDQSLRGKHFKAWMTDDWQRDEAYIREGREKIERKDKTIEILVPLKIGNSDMPWTVQIELPTATVLADMERMASALRVRGRRDLLMQVAVGAGLAAVALFGIWLISRRIVRPLKTSVNVANQIAEGDLHVGFSVESRDEIGQMMAAMKHMIAYLKNVADLAEQVANNDLSVTVVPKSERDTLNHSLSKMVENLRRVSAENARSMAAIEERNQAMIEQNWLKDGISQLSAALAGDLPLTEMCERAIRFVARYVKAGHGVLYTYHPQQQVLRLAAAFAFTERDHLSNEYRLGEGVIGQVAFERAPILMKHPPQTESEIVTGTTRLAPVNTYTFPLLYNGELHGVLELASFEPFGQKAQDFLSEADRVIATVLFSVMQKERVHDLLRQSEEAAHEAEEAKEASQRQAESAQAAAVRLEEQQQRLQQQNEELQQLNAQLEEQQQQLEQQREELRQQKEAFVLAQAKAARQA